MSITRCNKVHFKRVLGEERFDPTVRCGPCLQKFTAQLSARLRATCMGLVLAVRVWVFWKVAQCHIPVGQDGAWPLDTLFRKERRDVLEKG